jgi:AraC-like DNA-binding protein
MRIPSRSADCNGHRKPRQADLMDTCPTRPRSDWVIASEEHSVLAIACCDPALTASEFVDRLSEFRAELSRHDTVHWSGRLRPGAHPLSVLILDRLNYGPPDVLAWSLGEWASSLCVSTAHLGRLILADAGASFRDVRRLYRAKRSAQLLLVPRWRVSDVAFSIGYSHGQLGQFSREFRQVFGRAPSDFRSLVLTYRGSAAVSCRFPER